MRVHVWGVEVELHSFLTLAVEVRYMVEFTPRPLYPRENFPIPIELGGLLGPIAVLDVLEKRKSPAIAGIRSPDHVAHNLVGIPTTLLGLLRAPVIYLTCYGVAS